MTTVILSTEKTNNISFELGDELIERIQTYAELEHISPAVFFRQLMKCGLQHYEVAGAF